MMIFDSIAFSSPWLLLGLIALPILWWLLRAVPPAARQESFPGVKILLGLEDREKTPDKTPLWLLILRVLAVAAAIFAFALPVLNPLVRNLTGGPLLVVMDGGWASATDWNQRQKWAESVMTDAARVGRPVAFQSLGALQRGQISFQDARDGIERVAVMTPAPFAPDRARLLEVLPEGEFETLWLHDGIAQDVDAELIDALTSRGSVTMVSTGIGTRALTSVRLQEGDIRLDVARVGDVPDLVSVHAIGPDPSGIERVLARADGVFDEGAATAEINLDLPLELRNRISRFEVSQGKTAGGVQLASDDLKRRKVAILASASDGEGEQLTSDLHFLRKALIPTAELIEAPLADIMLTSPEMIVMADVGNVAPGEEDALIEWVEDGGLLLRFAGPRLAQLSNRQSDVADPLLPVTLRAGGRSVGGAMSWGAPKQLRPFDEDSPFFGLELPQEVDVSTQVMAEPGPELQSRGMAAREDGTPLVTGASLGEGRVILFHVTANAEWSSLPLSGLFVQMLERLALLSGTSVSDAEALDGQQWTAMQVLNGFGRLVEAEGLAGVAGDVLSGSVRDAFSPPGLYASGDRRAAINLLSAESELAAMSAPAGVVWENLDVSEERPLKSWLLLLAITLFCIDVIATLFVSGRMRNAVAAGLVVCTLPLAPMQAEAQESDIDAILNGTNNTVLAYVETGDARLDETSRAGLSGLSRVLSLRTAIEPVEPVAINLETDELAIYPFLYWPMSEQQDVPSDEAYARLNGFLRSGGMILFDTRDAQLSGGAGFGTPNGRVLQKLTAKLDIPPLSPVPPDHVLTRTFYLLQSFPGRWNGRSIWVEAVPEVDLVEGMPFRNLNDGVTPIVIGGNDWAAAWAIDDQQRYLFPVGRGSSGERQREMAFRFGVNLIMHVMTGNYKSDQVHVPALLERLGQ